MPHHAIALASQPEEKPRLRAVFDQAGLSCSFCLKGSEAIERARLEQAHLILVCDQPPDMDRLSWLRVLRQADWARDIAVVFMDARKSEGEIVEAFQWGADDFIQHPCEPLELSARLRAVLRRRYERQAPAAEPVSCGPLTLDAGRHECRVRGKTIELRRREFELLEILMRKPGRVLSRAYLLESIWGMSSQADTRAVDVSVSRLRQALGARAGRWIETVSGFGYRLRGR